MKCNFFYYYSKDTSYQEVLKQVPKLENCLFVTNRTGLKLFFEKNELSIIMVDDIMPDPGDKALQAYIEAKKIQKEYKKIFKDFTSNDISSFIGYEYDLLRRLTFLIKAKEILKKEKNIIFVFEEFHPTYYSVLNISKEMNYDDNEQIRYIKKNKVLEISYSNYKEKLEKKHFQLLKIKNFIQSNTKSQSSKENFLIKLRFLMKIISLGLKIFIIKKFNKNESVNIIKKFNNKLSKISSSTKIDTLFFVTAVREDLYIQPWKNVWDKYKNNNKNYMVITSDLSSSITLDKQNLQYLNIFEEVNLLEKNLKNSDLGKEIIKKISDINEKKIIGFNELKYELLSKTFRAMAIIILVENILKKFNVKSTVLMADGEMLENITAEVCKKYKISSYAIPHVAIYPVSIFSDWFHAEKIFTYGDQATTTLKKLGYDENRFILTGSLKNDNLKKYNKIEAKDHLQFHNNIDKNKKLIVIATSMWRDKDEEWLPQYIKFCNKNNFELIIKLHPKYSNRNRELSEIKIHQIKKTSGKFQFHIIYDINLDILLSASDLVITDYSTVGIEAVLSNKPLIMINFRHENWNDISQRFDKDGAAIYIEDYNKLENLSKEILVQNEHINSLNEGRKKVIKKFNYLNDGKASERIFNILTKSNQ